MAEVPRKESANVTDTEYDSVTHGLANTAADAKDKTTADDVANTCAEAVTEEVEPGGEVTEEVLEGNDTDEADTFPFDSLDDCQVVDEVEDPVDGDNEAADDSDKQKGGEEGLPEGNKTDVVMEETSEVDIEEQKSAEHTSQEEHDDEEISGKGAEPLENAIVEEDVYEEKTEAIEKTEVIKEGDQEDVEEEAVVEGEEGVEEEYEEEVEGEGEEVEEEGEEEMEAEEQEEYGEDEGAEEEYVEGEEEYVEGEEEVEEEVQEEQEEDFEEDEGTFEEEEKVVEEEGQETKGEECDVEGEEADESEDIEMAVAAKNLQNLQKAVIVYHVKPDDLKDVLLQPCLRKAICFCVRFLGPKGCTKGGHLEARFSTQEEAKEQMEMINKTVFKNGKKLKASMLGPGGGPMDWLLNEWQKTISPAGIFESRCVFVSNVPSFAREEMLRALYPTAECVNLPQKPDGQTNGYAMLEFPTQEEAEEIVQHSEKFQARIGNSNLKLTILGQTKIPSGDEAAGPGKADKPEEAKNSSLKAENLTKSAPKKEDTMAVKLSVKRKKDTKRASSRIDLGKKTAVKKNRKDKETHSKEKLSDSSRKSSSKDDGGRGNKKTGRDSERSGSTSRRSEQQSVEQSSRRHRSTSSSQKKKENERGKSSSKSGDKPKHKDKGDGIKTDLSVTSKKMTDPKAKNQGGQKKDLKDGEQKKGGSGTLIPVQLGRTGNAAKRPIETNVIPSRSDKRGRFDGPAGGQGHMGPYPTGMNPGSGGPIMRKNFPQRQPNMMRSSSPPNMMNPGMGRMPHQNFLQQNMMMGQHQPMPQPVSQPIPQSVSQPMSRPVSQPGMNTNIGPPLVPRSEAPGPDQHMMGPMCMAPGQMNSQQQQQPGYGMDNRNSPNWPMNRNPGNMTNNWDQPGGVRGEPPEEIRNLRGELLKQLQVLETGNVSDPSDLSYIAQKLKQVQQSRNQAGFSGPQQGNFPPGPQGNYQQPPSGSQGNMRGDFENVPNSNQQGNFASQPNMQPQQAALRNWPNQPCGAGPQGDSGYQYGYQSYNNNLQSNTPYGENQMCGDNSGMPRPGGMDSYHTAKGSGMPGGMTSYDSNIDMDGEDVLESQPKKLKTICVLNLPKFVNYTEVKRFIRKEMVSRKLCKPQDLPVTYVYRSKKGFSTIMFDTETQANNALQLDGIKFQGHILNFRRL